MPSPKQVVLEQLDGLAVGKVSVRKGRGTARHWITVKTDTPIPRDVQDKIEHQLLSKGLCGSYWPDDGFSNDNIPCVTFQNHWGRLQ